MIANVHSCMSNKLSEWPDGISNEIIHKISTWITKELTDCRNKSFGEACFPEKLKLTKLSPVFKKGDRSFPNMAINKQMVRKKLIKVFIWCDEKWHQEVEYQKFDFYFQSGIRRLRFGGTEMVFWGYGNGFGGTEMVWRYRNGF